MVIAVASSVKYAIFQWENTMQNLFIIKLHIIGYCVISPLIKINIYVEAL